MHFGELYSAGNFIELQDVDTSGAAIVLNLNSAQQKTFAGDSTIAAPAEISLANAQNGREFFMTLTIDAGVALTLPDDFEMDNALWDPVAKTWTPLDAGNYLMHVVWNGAAWYCSISQSQFA